MKQLFSWKYLLLFPFLFGASVISAKTPESKPVMSHIDSMFELRNSRYFQVKNRFMPILDVKTPRNEIGRKLYRVTRHPALDSLLTPEKEREILAEINRRCDELGKDSLLTSELFYVMKPHFDWMNHEDPHCRIYQRVVVGDNYPVKKFWSRLRGLPFKHLCVNDTVIVHQSLDPLFKRGDMITSINGVTMPEYLKYNYQDRYSDPMDLMHSYFASDVVDNFKVELIRNGETMEVETVGFPMKKIWFKTDYKIRIFEDSRCGYIAIDAFYPVNSVLIKSVRNAILDFKAKGCTNVILDLRTNLGGYGDRFDELLSIFINKPTIQNIKGRKLMVSKETLSDYDFLTEDMIGKVVNIPDKDIVKEFPTNPKMYVDGMTYYVMMSRNTGSVASTFCNMMQYNDAAKLVGEPMMHNATKYGDEVDGGSILPTLLRETSISTTEDDQYTRAVDGTVMPDIPIPYVAADYLTGKDGMLEKLLTKIK